MAAQPQDKLLQILTTRFAGNMQRHPKLDWSAVEKKLLSNPAKLRALEAMEQSGGEPDVVSFGQFPRDVVFCDCSAESPTGRRSLCYDREALDSRKENKPKGSAEEMAEAMGAEILDETLYRELQNRGEFDRKTSSWIKTPPDIRKRGGALFCDRRYDHVFTYHNGAESYYGARAFRTKVSV